MRQPLVQDGTSHSGRDPHLRAARRPAPAGQRVVCGTDRDVFVDAGLGLVSLRANLPGLFDRDPMLVVTHTHLDHSGGAYEFADVAVHPAEADMVERPGPTSLFARELFALLGIADADFIAALPEVPVETYPSPGFDPAAFAIRPAAVTRTVQEGDRIDLGDRQLTVVHLPGHSPGSIGLLDEHAGTLFSGDALYDGVLDTVAGSDVSQYRSTMQRLSTTACDVVYPGHGTAISPARAHEIATRYLRSRLQTD